MTDQTLWQTISSTLSKEIKSGHFLPGMKLPTEADLARRFGVNRHTVRRALLTLKQGGMIASQRGAGVYVLHSKTDYKIGERVRFHQNLLDSGRSPSREWLTISTRNPDMSEMRALKLSKGDEVHIYEGKSLADNVPIALFKSVFPAKRFPDLPEKLMANQSVTISLKASGVADYKRLSTQISAVLPSPTQRGQLKLNQDIPLLKTLSINVDLLGNRIEFGTTWFASDRVSLTLESHLENALMSSN